MPAADRARTLRSEQTEAERLLWSHLRDRGLGGAKFKRQRPFGPYFLDFYCHEARLAFEIDGGQHFEPPAITADEERTAFLKARGLTVLRFTNSDVMGSLSAVLEAIL